MVRRASRHACTPYERQAGAVSQAANCVNSTRWAAGRRVAHPGPSSFKSPPASAELAPTGQLHSVSLPLRHPPARCAVHSQAHSSWPGREHVSANPPARGKTTRLQHAQTPVQHQPAHAHPLQQHPACATKRPCYAGESRPSAASNARLPYQPASPQPSTCTSCNTWPFQAVPSATL